MVPSPDSIYEAPNSNLIWNSLAEGELAYGFVDAGSVHGGPFFHRPYPGNYLAFSFVENGERHYGAFDIGMFLFSSIQFYRYAYESEPDTPFFIRNNDLVPELSVAALTGMACCLLSLRRRRQRIPIQAQHPQPMQNKAWVGNRPSEI